MTNRGNVVLLDLLVLFPGFTTGDRQQLVDLAGVVDVMACDGGQLSVVWQFIETPQQAGMRRLGPGDDLVKVALARVDRVAQTARPVFDRAAATIFFERRRITRIPAAANAANEDGSGTTGIIA